MKLYRFTAADNHKAMLEVHEKLGPDAMIYTTRKTLDGTEILAGLPNNRKVDIPKEQEVGVQNGINSQQMIESMNNQIQVMNEHIQQLTNTLLSLQQTLAEAMRKKKILSWAILKNKLLQFKKFIKERILYRRQAAH